MVYSVERLYDALELKENQTYFCWKKYLSKEIILKQSQNYVSRNNFLYFNIVVHKKFFDYIIQIVVENNIMIVFETFWQKFMNICQKVSKKKFSESLFKVYDTFCTNKKFFYPRYLPSGHRCIFPHRSIQVLWYRDKEKLLWRVVGNGEGEFLLVSTASNRLSKSSPPSSNPLTHTPLHRVILGETLSTHGHGNRTHLKSPFRWQCVEVIFL